MLQELHCHEPFSTYSNELKQVVLNLIKNAEDVLLEKAVEDPYIKIVTYTKENNYIMEVIDNAEGVPEEIDGDPISALRFTYLCPSGG